MNAQTKLEDLTVGFDVPALPGMDAADIQTPCLVLDLDALERNIKKMGDYAKAHGMRHRVHGKMHKSVDVAKLQERLGGAVGVCCQKVSEAEVFARGGIKDILVSNHVSEIYTASEQEIIDAMKLTWKHLRVVMEPSSAVPLATILKNPDAFKGKRVGVIITGGNVDLDKLPWLTS